MFSIVLTTKMATICDTGICGLPDMNTLSPWAKEKHTHSEAVESYFKHCLKLQLNYIVPEIIIVCLLYLRPFIIYLEFWYVTI